jgi:hypothetical protein
VNFRNIKVYFVRILPAQPAENSLGRYNDALITDGLIKDGNIMVLDVNEDRIEGIEIDG